jgi:hypothetical protein
VFLESRNIPNINDTEVRILTIRRRGNPEAQFSIGRLKFPDLKPSSPVKNTIGDL